VLYLWGLRAGVILRLLLNLWGAAVLLGPWSTKTTAKAFANIYGREYACTILELIIIMSNVMHSNLDTLIEQSHCTYTVELLLMESLFIAEN